MKAAYAACSNVGRIRSNNEDNLYCDGSFLEEEHRDAPFEADGESCIPCVFAVCDGIGGSSEGEFASLAAVTKLKEAANYLKEALPENLDNAVHQYVYDANDVICRRIREMRSHLGTTLALAVITKDAARLYNIGDSRIYALIEGKLRQVSEDHTVTEQKVKLNILTKEQAKKDRDRHTLTRHLGVFEEDVSIAATSYDPLPRTDKYKILLCSDGLSDMVEDDRIEAILLASASPKEAVDNLINEALKNGGRDNVTCIVIEDEGFQKNNLMYNDRRGFSEEATVKDGTGPLTKIANKSPVPNPDAPERPRQPSAKHPDTTDKDSGELQPLGVGVDPESTLNAKCKPKHVSKKEPPVESIEEEASPPGHVKVSSNKQVASIGVFLGFALVIAILVLVFTGAFSSKDSEASRTLAPSDSPEQNIAVATKIPEATATPTATPTSTPTLSPTPSPSPTPPLPEEGNGDTSLEEGDGNTSLEEGDGDTSLEEGDGEVTPVEEPEPSVTASPSPSRMATTPPVTTATLSPVPAATLSPVPTATQSPSLTATPSPSQTATPLPSQTATPSPSQTATPSPSSTAPPSPSPTAPPSAQTGNQSPTPGATEPSDSTA
ncbi:MAG: protein phosphatase 2C domain-containing protein [Clostridiales bacterium]|nr:protein phosphatase 2C domain-containing protein [Clostridiales bacterium]